MNISLDKIALILVIIGALNWLLVGILSFDLVAAIFGSGAILSRIIYTLIGVAGIWAVSLLIRPTTEVK